MGPHFNFWTKQGLTVSDSNNRDIALYGCSEIIRTRNFTIFTVYATILDYLWELLIFRKRSMLNAGPCQRFLIVDHPMNETIMNEGLSVGLLVESWTCWKSLLKQEKYPYNTGTSENILWSNSSIQTWSISKNWKTCHVIKTGPTEKFLENKRSTI